MQPIKPIARTCVKGSGQWGPGPGDMAGSGDGIGGMEVRKTAPGRPDASPRAGPVGSVAARRAREAGRGVPPIGEVAAGPLPPGPAPVPGAAQRGGGEGRWSCRGDLEGVLDLLRRSSHPRAQEVMTDLLNQREGLLDHRHGEGFADPGRRGLGTAEDNLDRGGQPDGQAGNGLDAGERTAHGQGAGGRARARAEASSDGEATRGLGRSGGGDPAAALPPSPTPGPGCRRRLPRSSPPTASDRCCAG